MFSKATPAADASKLKPGVALPHVTLPTTEASGGAGGASRQQVQPPAAAEPAAARAPRPPPRVAASEALTMLPLFRPPCPRLPGRPRGDWGAHGPLAAGGGIPREARPALRHVPGGAAGGRAGHWCLRCNGRAPKSRHMPSSTPAHAHASAACSAVCSVWAGRKVADGKRQRGGCCPSAGPPSHFPLLTRPPAPPRSPCPTSTSCLPPNRSPPLYPTSNCPTLPPLPFAAHDARI